MIPNKKIYNHSFLYGLGDLSIETFRVYNVQTPIEDAYVIRDFIPRRGLGSRKSERVVNYNSYWKYGKIKNNEAE